MAIASLLGVSVVSCTDGNDWDVDSSHARLFAPTASLETNRNAITASWSSISGATQYNLALYRVSSTDEEGNNSYELVETATCESSPYTFENLIWEEKYKVEINCTGVQADSKTSSTNDVTVVYPTCMKSVKTIEDAARIMWDLNGDLIRAIVAKSDDGSEPIVVTVSEEQYNKGNVDVMDLTPNTKYTFYAYTDEEEHVNSTYAGKITGTTTKPINFDELYGEGMWYDARELDDAEAKGMLANEDFWAEIKDGMTVILKGEFDYDANNKHAIEKSVRFVTAATLGDNARFVSTGGLGLAKNVTVDFLEFVDVDFISDKALPGGGNEIVTNTDKGFGGRQVFNINGTNSTLKKLSFDGCKIEGYRAVVRGQADNDNVNEIVFANCILNGIGDQGVITTTNKLGDLQKVTFKNSTITNIVMLADLRATVGDLTFNIENCTFCYAPIETNANANTPMFRFGGNNNTIKLNVTNSLFGPSLFAGGNGGNIKAYNAGTVGSIFVVSGANTLVSVSNSYKTNFGWTEIKNATTGESVTYPLEGLTELNMNEESLWTNPAEGEFKIKANLGESGIGDLRWAN